MTRWIVERARARRAAALHRVPPRLQDARRPADAAGDAHPRARDRARPTACATSTPATSTTARAAAPTATAAARCVIERDWYELGRVPSWTEGRCRRCGDGDPGRVRRPGRRRGAGGGCRSCWGAPKRRVPARSRPRPERLAKRGDVGRAGSAAATQPGRPEARPGRHDRWLVAAVIVGDPVPCRRVPTVAAVRVGDERPGGGLARDRQQRRGDAEAPCSLPRWPRSADGRHGHRLGDRFAGRCGSAVATGVAQPGGTSTSSRSRTSTSASRTVGIVSNARRSAPASTRASIRGRWKSASAAGPGW